MSAQPVSKGRVPVRIELSPEPAPRALTLRWGVSRRALGERAPAGACALVHLELRLDPDAPPSWVLRDPRSGQTAMLPTPAGPEIDKNKTPFLALGGCLHIRCDQLHAIVRIDHAGGPELLYARTPIFGTLSIPGGRYRVLGAEIRDD